MVKATTASRKTISARQIGAVQDAACRPEPHPGPHLVALGREESILQPRPSLSPLICVRAARAEPAHGMRSWSPFPVGRNASPSATAPGGVAVPRRRCTKITRLSPKTCLYVVHMVSALESHISRPPIISRDLIGSFMPIILLLVWLQSPSRQTAWHSYKAFPACHLAK